MRVMGGSGTEEKIRIEEAHADFVARYPNFEKTSALDELRATEYRRLDERGHVYLDYTGGSLYAESQLEKHHELLRSGVLGNPHSANPASAAMTERVERTRRYALRYFNASPEDYVLVFTQNASGALKLVGESFPFAPGSRYLLTFDNHNSVNGIREFARARGAAVTYAPLLLPDLRLDVARLESLVAEADPAHENLFAFPAQSNFSGVKHSLELVAKAQSKGWRVLLDAAAFVPTNRLDLSAVQPDFVAVSFYKMFGYPTGVGALLVHRPAYAKLKRPWFAGGTVNYATVQGQAHVLSPSEAAFEDGTLNYLAIPAVEIGLRHVDRLLGLLDLLHGDGDAGQRMGAGQIALGLIEIDLAARHARLGLFECIDKAALIDLEQWLPFGHLLVVVNEDLADQAGDVGRHRDDVGAHAAVARPRLEHVIAPELPADGDRGGNDDQGDQHSHNGS